MEKQCLHPREAIKEVLKKRGRKENEHNEKNDEKKTGKQEAKAPSSDIAKDGMHLREGFCN